MIPPDDITRESTNLNPKGISLFSLIREDLATHRNDPISQGFMALAIHRLGNAAIDLRPKLLARMASVLYKVCARFVEWITGITILRTTMVGRRVHIWHHGGIIINASYIGDDVVLRQGTTLGQRFSGGDRPVVENQVNIGCNAVILGGIVVGEGSVIGAMSLVVNDIPPRSIVTAPKASVRYPVE